MPLTNNIQHLREWFRACPVLEKKNRMRVDYIAEKPTEYSIMASPSTIQYRENGLGERIPLDIQVQNYLFMSRNAYGSDIEQNIATEGLYQDIVNWVNEQNRKRNFPKVDEGEVRSITATLTVQLAEVGTDNALYQIPIAIEYKVE